MVQHGVYSLTTGPLEPFSHRVLDRHVRSSTLLPHTKLEVGGLHSLVNKLFTIVRQKYFRVRSVLVLNVLQEVAVSVLEVGLTSYPKTGTQLGVATDNGDQPETSLQRNGPHVLQIGTGLSEGDCRGQLPLPLGLVTLLLLGPLVLLLPCHLHREFGRLSTGKGPGDFG